jgi:hypothetical protein
MRHVREPNLPRVELRAVERGFATVAQPQRRRSRFRVDVDDVAAHTVADRAEIRMLDRSAHDYFVAGTQSVGPARKRRALRSELAVLEADRLCAGVKRVELLVRRLRDNQRLAARAAIGLCSVERAILELSLVSLDHNEPTVRIVPQCVLVLTRTPERLVAAVSWVLGADDP